MGITKNKTKTNWKSSLYKKRNFSKVCLSQTTFEMNRVSGHNGQVFDGNFVRLRERCVKTEVM